MGVPLAGGADASIRHVAGAFTATGAGAWMEARTASSVNVAVYGTFVATVTLECSFDGGTTAIPVSRDALGTPTSLTAPARIVVQEGEHSVCYRLNCTAWTSGTAAWRLSL
jgi:hypothetical protein